MSEHKSFRWLYRYTSLASALDIVRTGEIVLLDPRSWPDRNDVHYLSEYQRQQGLTSLCALCFTSAVETSHHWAAFAPGTDGVRLLFDRDALEVDVARVPGAVLRDVQYRKLEEAKLFRDEPGSWPFLKRHPYRGEREVRALFCCRQTHERTRRIALSPGTLKEIVLSPNLPPALKPAVIEAIRSLSPDGAKRPRIHQSTLLSNARWIAAIQDVSGAGAAQEG